MRENFTNLLMIIIGKIPVNEITNEAKEKPLKEKSLIETGTSIQVRIVQKTIKTRVILIFPIAFKAFTKGDENAAKIAAKAKK